MYISEKKLTHARVLAYAYITVKFQLRSSIIVPLTESSIYNRFAWKGPPKWGFGGNFGGRGKYIWWEPLRNATTADLRVFRHLWSRSDAPCSSIR